MLAYGAEAVVLVEISHSSPKIKAYNSEENEEGQRLALDLIDEVRDELMQRLLNTKRRHLYTTTYGLKKDFTMKGI